MDLDSSQILIILYLCHLVERLYVDNRDLINAWNFKHSVRLTPCHQDVISIDSEESTDPLDNCLDADKHR